MDRRVNSSGLSDCSELEEIQKLEPVAKVVKAFNTIFAELLPTKPTGLSPVPFGAIRNT